jgi:FkbM family methyltransferase
MERQWRAASCAKEPWTVNWLRDAVGPGDVLYDIGANVGTFSLVAAKHCGAHVVAFEPGYSSFARLCENIQLNGCQHAIVPVPLPLADTSGMVGFKYRSVDPGQSRHRLKPAAWRFRRTSPAEGRYEQPVLAIPLDDAVSRFRLPPPNHLKVDVDGAEDRVLAGARRTLRSRTLRTVLIEVDRANWTHVATLLEDAGLVLHQRFEREKKKEEAPLYGLFTRPPRQRWTPWRRP